MRSAAIALCGVGLLALPLRQVSLGFSTPSSGGLWARKQADEVFASNISKIGLYH